MCSLGIADTIRTFDYQDAINICYNASQLAVNILFWLRDHVPDAFAPHGHRNDTAARLRWDDDGAAEAAHCEGVPIGLYLTLQVRDWPEVVVVVIWGLGYCLEEVG